MKKLLLFIAVFSLAGAQDYSLEFNGNDGRVELPYQITEGSIDPL